MGKIIDSNNAEKPTVPSYATVVKERMIVLVDAHHDGSTVGYNLMEGYATLADTLGLLGNVADSSGSIVHPYIRQQLLVVQGSPHDFDFLGYIEALPSRLGDITGEDAAVIMRTSIFIGAIAPRGRVLSIPRTIIASDGIVYKVNSTGSERMVSVLNACVAEILRSESAYLDGVVRQDEEIRGLLLKMLETSSPMEMPPLDGSLLSRAIDSVGKYAHLIGKDPSKEGTQQLANASILHTFLMKEYFLAELRKSTA